MRKGIASIARWLAIGSGVAAGVYAACVIKAWVRYGSPSRSIRDDDDEILDTFMPAYDIVERHQIRVHAPTAVTFAAAKDMDLSRHPLIRAIFRARETILGSRPDEGRTPRGLLEQTKALGWVVLHETPGREIVMGSVTKPWEADVVFRSVAPAAFAGFSEPNYVKIAWTLRADPAGDGYSIFSTETRAVATDAEARRRFRRYWSFVSPGIALIRQLSLAPLRTEAERRAGAAAARSV